MKIDGYAGRTRSRASRFSPRMTRSDSVTISSTGHQVAEELFHPDLKKGKIRET
jgi:hypothetical protein